MTHHRKGQTSEVAFVQYMDGTPPMESVDSILDCFLLRWSTGEDVDYTTGRITMVSSDGGHKEIRSNIIVDTIKASECFFMVPFSPIEGSVHVLRFNSAVSLLSEDIPWAHHHLNINRF